MRKQGIVSERFFNANPNTYVANAVLYSENVVYFGKLHCDRAYKDSPEKYRNMHLMNGYKAVLTDDGLISCKRVKELVDPTKFEVYEELTPRDRLSFLNRIKALGISMQQGEIKIRSPCEYKEHEKREDENYRKNSFFGYLRNIKDSSLVLVVNPNEASLNLGYFKNKKFQDEIGTIDDNNGPGQRDSISKRKPDSFQIYDSLIIKLRPSHDDTSLIWMGHEFSDNGVSYSLADVNPISWQKNLSIVVDSDDMIKLLRKKAKRNHSLDSVIVAIENILCDKE